MSYNIHVNVSIDTHMSVCEMFRHREQLLVSFLRCLSRSCNCNERQLVVTVTFHGVNNWLDGARHKEQPHHIERRATGRDRLVHIPGQCNHQTWRHRRRRQSKYTESKNSIHHVEKNEESKTNQN